MAASGSSVPLADKTANFVLMILRLEGSTEGENLFFKVGLRL